MNRLMDAHMDFYDQAVVSRIMAKYGMGEMEAARAFLLSETHRMLEDNDLGMWEFGDLAIFEIWEVEREHGTPLASPYLATEAL